MTRIGIQADVISRLAAALPDVTVARHVPDPRPKRLVTVRRTGGPQLDRLRDRPQIGIEIWAESESVCEALAEKISAIVRSLPFESGYARIEETALRSDPDVISKSPRWYATYTITTYKYK